MTKVSYTKAESALDETLRKISIERLAELAAIANVINDPTNPLSAKTIEKVLKKFQDELKKMKETDPKLYAQLLLTEKDEKRFLAPYAEFTPEDWDRLRFFKVQIDALSKELYGTTTPSPEDQERIDEERRKHINKRFNIREGWLPLK